jgi:hypothetical protein
LQGFLLAVFLQPELQSAPDGAIAVDDVSMEFASGRHSGLAYRTPAEVAQTWEDGRNQLNHAA